MAKVFSTTIELLMVKVAKETMGNVGEHWEAIAFMVALPWVACSLGILLVVSIDSSHSRLHDFPP